MIKRNQITFELICEIIKQQKLENILEVFDFCDKYRNEFNLPDIKAINESIDGHIEMIRLYFDGSKQTNNQYQSQPNMSLTSSLKDKFDMSNLCLD